MEFLFLLILVLINAYFAAAEIAMISINDVKIRALAEEGDKKAALMQKLLQNSSRFLATIQIGVTLAGFLSSAVASQAFVDKMASAFTLPFMNSFAKPLAVAIVTVLLSFFNLIFGELVPKRIAMKNPEKFARFAIRSLSFTAKIATPFVAFLSAVTNLVLRIFGIDPKEDDDNVTEEEIRMMVDAGEETGNIGEIEKEMINNIFDFSESNLEEIMTHRTKVASLPVTATLEEVITLVNSEHFSRIPVYDESIDDIIGVLHVKDLLPRLLAGKEGEFNLKNLIRTPLYVPISREPHNLLKDMNSSKNHMAVVIDEYGGTAGIVTIEDLLEEIVGDIIDEYDEEEKTYEQVAEGQYIIKDNIEFDEFCEIIGYEPTEEESEEYDTMSGFVIGNLGRIPQEDEQPELTINGYQYRIVEVEDKQVVGLAVEKLPEEETDEDEED